MRTQAIVIKKVKTGEYDQLITCYTREFGKLTAIAKSILKPTSTQAMQLDTLNVVDFDLINGRAVPIIATAQAEKVHPGIRSSLPLLALASFFMEVVDKIVYDHERDDELWVFLTGLLDDLEHQGHTTPLLSFFRTKQLELLDILGYAQPIATTTSTGAFHSPLDALFEQTANTRFESLPFLYRILPPVVE